jgi:hypothetical protein
MEVAMTTTTTTTAPGASGRAGQEAYVASARSDNGFLVLMYCAALGAIFIIWLALCVYLVNSPVGLQSTRPLGQGTYQAPT